MSAKQVAPHTPGRSSITHEFLLLSEAKGTIHRKCNLSVRCLGRPRPPRISENLQAVQGRRVAGTGTYKGRICNPMADKVLPARKVLRCVCVLQNPSDSLRVRTEAVLTTHGSQKIARVLARRQHVFARTADCALSLTGSISSNHTKNCVTPLRGLLVII